MKTIFEGKKLYAVIIAFLLMITFFITFYTMRNHYQYVFKNVITENTLTANLLSSLLYEHQKAAISILESYAQRPLFIDAVKKKDFHRALYHLKSLSEHHSEIDNLFITDQYGTVWANYPVDSKGFGKNLAQRDWYKGVSKKWRPYISSVYRSIFLEKGLAVAVSVPVFDRKGKVVGILSGAHRTAFLATFFKANALDPEKSITLLDQEGNIIFSNAVPYQEKITKYPDARVLEKALAGVVIDMEMADPKEKGGISYVSIAPVKGMGWSVIVGQEKNAILKSLNGYFILYAVTGFVIFLFLTVSLLYFRKEYKYRKTKELLQAEEDLSRSRENFRRSLDDSPLGVRIVTGEGETIYANRVILDIYGYDSIEELNTTPIKMRYTPESYAEFQIRKEKRRQGLDIPSEYEVSIIRKNGGVRQLQVFRKEVLWDGERQFQVIYQDITERKRAEESLRLITDNMSDMVRVTDLQGVNLYSSPSHVKILGYKPEERVGKSGFEIVHPDDVERLIKVFSEGLTNKKPGKAEYRIKHADGHYVWLETMADAIMDDQGEVTAVIQSSRDITDRKRVEEKIKASILEKETMLKEIHHRVKNNLQVISSLLSLQASHLQDEKAREALQESMGRVETMASIHTQLYEFQDLTRVDFVSFIQDLIGNISQSYGRADSPVEINVDAGEISLGIDNSIPCGLILNELVSNALKHAFPEGKEGEINIRMRSEDNRVALTVQDNGIGFPELIDLTKVKSLGLDLVNILVRQMNGEIDMGVVGGTTWTITFPVKRDREWRNGQDEDHDC
jgi:PAS domain S-box-containing protein